MRDAAIAVGPRDADIIGSDHLAIQAAVDYVAGLGGGTVRLLPGVYEMGNSVFLRSKIALLGAGEDSILRKPASFSTRLVDDTDWYDRTVKVADPSIFRVGGGLLLRARSPHYDKQQLVKSTVVAIDGDCITLDRQPRENFWIDQGAEAVTLYPILTAEYRTDITIESLCIDGNRARNEHLNGNYGGGIFLQDCDRVLIRDVTTRDNNGDGMSWQVCNDVTVEECRSLNNADLGLHPGSGSQRPLVTNCRIADCEQGFFFCWGVKGGRVEGNVIENCGKYGISIGHRDTDNTVRGNTIRRSGMHGILFRGHPVSLRDPHRNVFEGNTIEDSGTEGECVAIEMQGATRDVVLRGNRIIDTRPADPARRRIGLRIGADIGRLTQRDNVYRGLEQDVADLRPACH